ncbi:hypothetical protein LINPERHAP1_LOCUS18023 [Linum perenne]
MHPDKAPGPDGLNPAFYQTFWDVVGQDVIQDCKQWLTSRHIPRPHEPLILFCCRRRRQQQEWPTFGPFHCVMCAIASLLKSLRIRYVGL